MAADALRLALDRFASELTLSPPASDASIVAAEVRLGHRLPPSLTSALRISDGIEGAYGLGVLWPTHRIVRENVRLRESDELLDLYMPFDGLIFFADAGNGDLFGLPSRVRGPDVFAWDHEDDRRRWVAPSIPDYVERWLRGDLRL